MRKLYLLVGSIVTIVAFTAFSATAFGLQDPRCEEEAGGGDPIVEMLDFSIDTPDSGMAWQNSSLVGSAYACGSDIGPLLQGAETLYNHADIGVPDGFQIADSDSVPVGSRTARATVNVLFHALLGAHFRGGVVTDVLTAPKSECQSEIDDEIVGSTPGNQPGSVLISCMYASDPKVGHNWNWNVRTADGKQWMTIGPMHGIAGVSPGLTYVNLELCAYFGDPGTPAPQCGTEGDQFQQINGCGYEDNFGRIFGDPTFTASATMRNGTVTPIAETNARWRRITISSPKPGPVYCTMQGIPPVPTNLSSSK